MDHDSNAKRIAGAILFCIVIYAMWLQAQANSSTPGVVGAECSIISTVFGTKSAVEVVPRQRPSNSLVNTSLMPVSPNGSHGATCVSGSASKMVNSTATVGR